MEDYLLLVASNIPDGNFNQVMFGKLVTALIIIGFCSALKVADVRANKK